MPITFDGELTINITLDGEFGQLQYYSDYKLYPGNMTVIPETEAQTLQTDGLIMPGDLVVEAIPSNYGEITYSGTTMNINAAEQHDVSRVNVTAGGETDSYYDVSDATLNNGSQMPRGVVGYGVGGARITGNVPEVTSADLIVSGRTVTAPAGFYAEDASASVQAGTEGTPVLVRSMTAHSATIAPQVTNTEGYIQGGTRSGSSVTVTAAELVSGTYNVTSSGTADVTNFESINVPAGEITPYTVKGQVSNHSVTITPVVERTAGYIPNGTVTGSVVTVDATELVSGTLTVNSGGTKDVTTYASAYIPYSVTDSPTLEIEEIPADHAIRITPKVHYTSGWVDGATDRGDVTVVAASDLVSGSQTITENATYNVSDLAQVVVNVAGTGELQTVSKTYTPTTSQQIDTILPGTGYAGMDEVDITVNAVPVASASGAISSTQYITDNGQRKWQITPAVYVESAGWIPLGETGASSPYTYNAVASGTVITPSTSSQTIGGANYMMEGAVTVNAMPNSQGSVELGREYITENNTRKYAITPFITVTNPGYIPSGTYPGDTVKLTAIPTGTTVTPTESQQTLGGSNYVMEGAVTVDAIPIVNYYATGIQESFTTRDSQRYCDLTPYIYPYDTGYIGVTGFVSKQLDTVEKHAVPATTITPTESVQTVGGFDYIMEGAVTINAIPSNYVGSGITQRSSSDLSISGNVVTAPAGYYPSAATYTLTNGNNLEYGITDGSIPRVGIAKVGSAEIGA